MQKKQFRPNSKWPVVTEGHSRSYVVALAESQRETAVCRPITHAASATLMLISSPHAATRTTLAVVLQSISPKFTLGAPRRLRGKWAVLRSRWLRCVV